MSPLELSLSLVLLAVVVLAILNANAAYRNGVTDGYGYSREPNCPGYAKAGEYLRKNMRHRWSELCDCQGCQRKFADNARGRIIPPQGGSGTAPPQKTATTA